MKKLPKLPADEFAISGNQYYAESGIEISFGENASHTPVAIVDADWSNGLCGIKVHATTTGYQGGDTGHGGRTSMQLDFDNLFGMLNASVIQNKDYHTIVNIEFGGDEELGQFIDALFTTAMQLQQYKNANKIKRIVNL